ncbi:MAG: DUF512 domain-containing protein, partial [Clostridia bacterium]|nr:DUF512 domain-containing protein [Clostridia bacterium]
TEVEESLENLEGDPRKRKVSVATGKLAAPYLEEYISQIKKKYPGIDAKVHAIRNDFFGEMITVSGLVTGQDIIAQLKGKDLGECLLIPCNMLRAGENVFLDDVTVEEIETKLEVSVIVVDEGGASLVHAVIDKDGQKSHRRRQIYEQADSSNCGTSECR